MRASERWRLLRAHARACMCVSHFIVSGYIVHSRNQEIPPKFHLVVPGIVIDRTTCCFLLNWDNQDRNSSAARSLNLLELEQLPLELLKFELTLREA